MGQVHVLFKHAQKRELRRAEHLAGVAMKFYAGIHGMDIGGSGSRGGPPAMPPDMNTRKDCESPSPRQASDKRLVFGDPKDYEHMSQEKRELLTQQMMDKWKPWAKNPMNTGRGPIGG